MPLLSFAVVLLVLLVVSCLSLAKTGQLEPYRVALQMPVRVYTFKVELIGSRNPVISRTFSVPASWTFQRLHAAIQYAFGWQNCHLHHFTFESARRPPTREERRFISMDHREKLVVIHMGTPEDEDDDWATSARARFSEKDIKLNDLFEETGKYRQMALKDGAMAKCYYLYDFGDNWEHQITLISVEKSTSGVKELKVIDASGCAPLEDSGGIYGWDEIKRAFATTNPSGEMRDRKRWGRQISPLGQAFNPAVQPSIEEFNQPGEFLKFLRGVRQAAGDGHNTADDQDDEDQIDIESLPAMPMEALKFGNYGPPINATAAQRRFAVHEGTHPLDLFVPAINACTIRQPRFIHTDVTRQDSVLLFVDGAVVNENTPDARAGCGVYVQPGTTGISIPLENIPGHARTRNRAELRAAIEALRARIWPGEGFMRIVIGTHAEYVVNGVCQWVPSWKQRRWKTSRGEAVKNRDLWEMLLTDIEKWEAMGIRVQFYLLKKEWNTKASDCARRGAEVVDVPTSFAETVYISVA